MCIKINLIGETNERKNAERKTVKTAENKRSPRGEFSKTLNTKEKTYKKEEKKNPRQKARFNEKSNSNCKRYVKQKPKNNDKRKRK